MSSSEGGWGRMKWVPVTAAVMGLLGGLAVGRYIHSRNHPDLDDSTETVAAIAAARARVEPIEAPVAAKAAAAAGLPGAQVKAPDAPPDKTPKRIEPPPSVAPKAAPPAVEVMVHFKSVPDGAEVVRTDTKQTLGTTPCDARLGESAQTMTFAFHKKGYALAEKKLALHGETTVSVELSAAARKKKPHAVGSGTTIDPFQ